MKPFISIQGIRVEKIIPYVIAEMSANHNGKIKATFKIIENAKTAERMQ